jgi:hypothetical protein
MHAYKMCPKLPVGTIYLSKLPAPNHRATAASSSVEDAAVGVILGMPGDLRKGEIYLGEGFIPRFHLRKELT